MDASIADTPVTTLIQFVYILLTQADVAEIDPTWICLDSRSIKDLKMLKRIRCSLNVLRAMTNSGHQDSNVSGNAPN